MTPNQRLAAEELQRLFATMRAAGVTEHPDIDGECLTSEEVLELILGEPDAINHHLSAISASARGLIQSAKDDAQRRITALENPDSREAHQLRQIQALRDVIAERVATVTASDDIVLPVLSPEFAKALRSGLGDDHEAG